MRNLALAGMRVLVMEDEILIAMDVEQLCRDHGAAEVVVVHALEQEMHDGLLAQNFDAAILDVALGGQSTLPFAARLVARGVPFIFATGHVDNAGQRDNAGRADNESLFEDFPGVAIVGKPYGETMLIEALTRSLFAADTSSGSA